MYLKTWQPYGAVYYHGESICAACLQHAGHYGRLNPQSSFFPPIAKKSAPPLADSLAFITACEELTHKGTEGVAVPVWSLLNAAVERIVTVRRCQPFPVHFVSLTRTEEKRRTIHCSLCCVRSLRQQGAGARANMQEEVGQLQSTDRSIVVFLCEQECQQSSLRPACAWLPDMIVKRSYSWRLCFLGA